MIEERRLPPDEEVRRVSRIQDQHLDDLFALPHVAAVGTGLRQRQGAVTDEVCVVVFVDRKVDQSELAAHEVVPAQLAGPDETTAEVDVVEGAPVEPLT